MLQLKQNNKYLLAIGCLLILLLPGIWGMMHSGFFLTDDGNWMIIRFSAFYEALKSGQFPVRFLPRLNNEYGYPVADFLYPLFMYLSVPIKILGFSFVNTIKIVLGGSLLISGVFCSLWLKKIYPLIPTVIAAVVYALFPYHVWDIYTRGSVGEVLALAIVPFVLWQMERQSILFSSIGIGLLITAHNTMALLFLPVLFLYQYVRKLFTPLFGLYNFLLGLGLAAFFWLPALYDKQFTVFDTVAVSNFFSYFASTDTLSLLGIITIIGVIGGIYSFVVNKGKTTLFFLIITLLSIFFALPVSSLFWHIIPGKGFIQFPFRLLSVTTLGIGYLMASSLDKIKKMPIMLATISLVFLYFSSWHYFFPKTYQLYPDGFYTTNEDTTTVHNEYMPKWVNSQKLKINIPNVAFVTGSGSISSITAKGTRQEILLQSDKQSVIRLHTVYFPGWEVWVNNKKTPIDYMHSFGLIQFTVPQGSTKILLQFVETPLRLLSDTISVITCIILFLTWVSLKRKKI